MFTHWPLTWSPCAQLRNASSSASYIGRGGKNERRQEEEEEGGKHVLEGGQILP